MSSEIQTAADQRQNQQRCAGDHRDFRSGGLGLLTKGEIAAIEARSFRSKRGHDRLGQAYNFQFLGSYLFALLNFLCWCGNFGTLGGLAFEWLRCGFLRLRWSRNGLIFVANETHFECRRFFRIGGPSVVGWRFWLRRRT